MFGIRWSGQPLDNGTTCQLAWTSCQLSEVNKLEGGGWKGGERKDTPVFSGSLLFRMPPKKSKKPRKVIRTLEGAMDVMASLSVEQMMQLLDKTEQRKQSEAKAADASGQSPASAGEPPKQQRQ
jgi:hypothetical protein